jgi:hypothetical protein
MLQHFLPYFLTFGYKEVSNSIHLALLPTARMLPLPFWSTTGYVQPNGVLYHVSLNNIPFSKAKL